MTRKSILIVDDELLLLLSMQRMLSDLYDVTTALSGQKAIDIINQADKKFDLIICDVSMPEINGANLYLYLANKYPGLEKKIIFMTGGPLSAYLDEFFTDNKKLCLAKPFQYDELRAAIEKVLHSKTKKSAK